VISLLRGFQRLRRLLRRLQQLLAVSLGSFTLRKLLLMPPLPLLHLLRT